MLLRQADVPASWSEDGSLTDNTLAARSCFGFGPPAGLVGYATVRWALGEDAIGQYVSVFESVTIFANESDAKTDVDRIARAGPCEAAALNHGQGDYTYNYQRFHRSSAAISAVTLPLYGDESQAQHLTYDISEGSGDPFHVYVDRVTMRRNDVTYRIDVTSFSAADDGDARDLAQSATNRVDNPIPITLSPPLNGPVSPPPAD